MTPPKPIRATKDWSETALWILLDARTGAEEDQICNLLKRWLPQIQTILTASGTAPTAFTLHDANHSFRVAQRMAEIVPNDVLPQLSSYEIALLLLAAYLHDIGMAPEEKNVSLHYEYLLTGPPSGLKEKDGPQLGDDDIAALQKWLDEDERGVSIPIFKDTLTVDDLRLANELVAHYCRYRHNDWSEAWIRKNLAGETLASYAGWLDDLVILCRSHHQGKPELLNSAFDPRPVGSPARVVHLRYLACVLRVADILEFDPERTPEVILRQRDIPANSLIYWHKDHGISMVKEGDRLSVAARPSTAIIHRAIEIMMDDIDTELLLTRSLSDETHFENCANLKTKLAHRWDLQHAVQRDLRAQNDTYEYIDGTFRPNTRKILELLSGTQLYHDPLTAVRELVQNAFDAVREQIAYQRLSQKNPRQLSIEEVLGALHRVEVRVESRSEGAWLTCSDTGVGMTKFIIKNHLLVSGQSRRHDTLALERRCRDAGFRLGRTGQFGIGVLSYFMIADRVVVTTRRALEPGDTDPSGWRFVSDGIGSFGELRRDSSISTAGSRVDLRLNRKISEDLVTWFAELRTSLKTVLRNTPCEFQLTSSLPGCEPLSLPPGWTLNETEDLQAMMLQGLVAGYPDSEIPAALLTQGDREELEGKEREHSDIKRRARQQLRWIVESGDLPKGLGQFRLHLPYFEQANGSSLAFLNVESKDGRLSVSQIGKGFYYIPPRKLRVSWKGIEVSIPYSEGLQWTSANYKGDNAGPFVEVDFQSTRAGSVSVDRGILSLSETAFDAFEELRQICNQFCQRFLTENTDSAYALLNYRLLPDLVATVRDPMWVRTTERKENVIGEWGTIAFPALTSLPWVYEDTFPSVTYEGEPAAVLRCLGGPSADDHYDGVSFVKKHTPPDRIVEIQNNWRFTVAPLWMTNPSLGRATSGSPWMRSSFSPKWIKICAVKFGSYSAASEEAVVLNSDHVLALKQVPNVVFDANSSDIDPLTVKSELLSDPDAAAAWLLRFVIDGTNQKIWNGLRERDEDFVLTIWRLLFPEVENFSVDMWVQDSEPRLRRVNPQGWQVVKKSDRVRFHMPDPGNAWSLTVSRPNFIP